MGELFVHLIRALPARCTETRGRAGETASRRGEDEAMANYSRRDFLRMGAFLAAGLGLGRGAAPVLAEGLQRIFTQQKRVLWLQGMSCSGCSVSFLNSEEPGPLEILTQMMSLVYHPTVSATQGEQALETIRALTKAGGYYLIFEGSIPAGMPEACMLGARPLTELLPDVLRNAELVISAGSCAAYGGIPAGEGGGGGGGGATLRALSGWSTSCARRASRSNSDWSIAQAAPCTRSPWWGRSRMLRAGATRRSIPSC